MAAVVGLVLFPSVTLMTAQGVPDTVRWSVVSSAPAIGAPMIAGTLVVLPLENGTVAAHRVSDGSLIWTAKVTGERPLASDGSHVYVISGETIHALDLATGATAWRMSAGAKLTAPPLSQAGWVVAAAGGEVLAIRAIDGAVIWRTAVGPVEFRPALDGDLLVVPVADGRVTAFDLPSGAKRWESPLGAAPGEPIAIGGRVFVGTLDKFFYSLDETSGRIDYHRRVGAEPRQRAAADERHVYFAALDNVLYAIDRGNGNFAWKQGLKYRPSAGPVLIDGRVVVPASSVDSLPAFMARNGTPAGEVRFGALLGRPPAFTHDGGTPLAVGIVGGLENRWTLTMLVPSVLPRLEVDSITSLPGEVVPAPVPPVR